MGDVIRMVTGASTRYLTAGQAAAMMGCSTDYLYRLKRAGFFVPVTKVGSALVYRREDIERYIETHPRLGKRAIVL